MAEWQPMDSAPKDRAILTRCIERGWGDRQPTYTVQQAKWAGNYFRSLTGAIPEVWTELPE